MERRKFIPRLRTSDFVLLDRHFNRAWVGSSHLYLDNTGERDRTGDVIYQGWVKCKLVEGRGLAILTPDILILGTDPSTWIQPLHFFAHRFLRLSDDLIVGSVWVDISCGQSVLVAFKNVDRVLHYPDGSELYKCEILGPPRLEEYVTGVASWVDGRPQILLYHHTTKTNERKIRKSGYFKGSRWNIRGNKELEDTHHVYATCLPRLDCDNCMKSVAMASDGTHFLRLDWPPSSEMRAGEDTRPDVAVPLTIYRESTRNRAATIDFWVDPGQMAPQHLLMHHAVEYGLRQLWYEVVLAFTYSLAVPPGKVVPLSGDVPVLDYRSVAHAERIIIGPAWIPAGLLAPFDEDKTECLFGIVRPPTETTILDFWFDPENSERFRVLEMTEELSDEDRARLLNPIEHTAAGLARLKENRLPVE